MVCPTGAAGLKMLRVRKIQGEKETSVLMACSFSVGQLLSAARPVALRQESAQKSPVVAARSPCFRYYGALNIPILGACFATG